MLVEEACDLLPDRRPGALEGLGLDVLEGQVDDRVALEVGPVGVARLPDGEVLRRGGRGPRRASRRSSAASTGSASCRSAAGGGGGRPATPGSSRSSRIRCGLVDVLEALLAELAEVVDADGDGSAWRARRDGTLARGGAASGGADGARPSHLNPSSADAGEVGPRAGAAGSRRRRLPATAERATAATASTTSAAAARCPALSRSLPRRPAP